MKIGHKLKQLREEHNLTLEQLADKLKEKNEDSTFNKGRMSKWENNKEEPRLSSIKAIADFYGVNIDSFYKEEVASDSISTIYNQLELPRQAKVYNYADHQLSEQNRLHTIEVIGQTAAGSGLTYGDDDVEEREVKSVPQGAEAAIVVQGDSMTPTIDDGDIIFYKRQADVENGEIAVVELYGNEVTTKKVKFDYENRNIVLESINDEYDDMVFNDNEVRILGKVLFD